MTTRLAVANAALARLGPLRIAAWDAPDPVAVAIRDVWDGLRRAELQAYSWSFALRTGRLVEDGATPPAPGWSHVYLLPPDCLRLLVVRPDDPSTAYTILGDRLHTGLAPPLTAKWIADVTEPAAWDPLFAEAFACRLAAVLAERLTQSSTAWERATRDYESAIARARRASSMELPPRRVLARTPWLEV